MAATFPADVAIAQACRHMFVDMSPFGGPVLGLRTHTLSLSQSLWFAMRLFEPVQNSDESRLSELMKL